MRSSVSSRLSDVVSALLVDASECDRETIAPHLHAYPTPLLERLVAEQYRIRPLAQRERYRDVSPARAVSASTSTAGRCRRRGSSSSKSARCTCARGLR